VRGPAVLHQMITMFRASFPDLHFDIQDMFAEGDRVAARCTMTGTHKGEFMGIPPTNKAFRITAFDILRFEGSKVAEHWGITDQAGMMQQLGLMPGPQ
jgi:steroid delta-isomerase-like uncharacterized protein